MLSYHAQSYFLVSTDIFSVSKWRILQFMVRGYISMFVHHNLARNNLLFSVLWIRIQGSSGSRFGIRIQALKKGLKC